MSSSDRLFNRERDVHEIFGGGLVADLMLWKHKNLNQGILIVAFAAWVVFERSGYTLVTFVSAVLLLLFSILFLWAKSAAIVNRPAPPLPDFYLSEETVSKAASFIRKHINALLSISQDIALGKDTQMFMRVATYLLLISVIGCLMDFVTLGYISLVIVLTVPALYERYEDQIDKYVLLASRKMMQLYVILNQEYICKVKHWIMEKQKIS
ncbi:reticulon-like protein B12 [Apium graveolens]|uniref:reticulon-like protein B12 n=1 Tax=Apium graveolens TaxID=4045 RepID=UPI003D793619